MDDEKKVSLQKDEVEINSEPTTSVLSQKNLEQGKDEPEVPKKRLWVQMRILPIYVRVILVILLLVVVAIIGLTIGYGYMGDGNPSDVLKKETWTHILDIVKGKE